MTLAYPNTAIDVGAAHGGGRLDAMIGLAGRLWQRARAAAGAILVARPAARVAVRADLPGGDRAIAHASAPMTTAEQWARAIAPLEAATASARAMRDLHSAATKQLNSVDYALEQLIDDLSDILTVPRAPSATVHTLRAVGPAEFASAPQPGAALAA